MRILITLFLLAALAVGGFAAWQIYVPVTPTGQRFVMLHSGYSPRRIASELKKAGIIRSELAFRLWHGTRHAAKLKAGEYLFEREATLPQVYDRIARGDIYFHVVTIPEGFTMFDIAKAMEDAGLCSADDFLHLAETQTQLVSDIAPDAKSLEGYLFPNTYQFTRTQSLEEMTGAMVHQFRQVAREIGLIPAMPDVAVETGLAPSQAQQAASLPSRELQKGTHPAAQKDAAKAAPSEVEKVVTMASIVEKETAAPDERPRVASVYYNRLTQKMALDADPSVIYAEQLAGTYTGSLHHADMSVNSPYNTYRFAGLPPGPIANPGRSALEAAMHPDATKFLYFVSDGNGHHRFAASLAEHNRNVEAYRRAVGAR